MVLRELRDGGDGRDGVCDSGRGATNTVTTDTTVTGEPSPAVLGRRGEALYPVGRDALLIRSVKSAFACAPGLRRIPAEKERRVGFMRRTISVMVGKGSVNHNSRKFHAMNTDPARSGLNRSYCNEDIRRIYHEMFDEAVNRYNEKQTRSDRTIADYYEKIRSGKQEKPFHEIILQVGNHNDMNAKTEDGELAATVLDDYMQSFQSRNPNMRVFSAHLHIEYSHATGADVY
jgi:hypothetical protein